MSDRDRLYCPIESCPNNIGYSCNLGQIPLYYTAYGNMGNLGFSESSAAVPFSSVRAEGVSSATLNFTKWQNCPRITKNRM